MFEAKPSKIDIQNHQSYQNMFSKEGKPFIGCIVSPYYSKAKSRVNPLEASFRSLCQTICFQNESKGSSKANSQPYNLDFKMLPESQIKKRIYDSLLSLTQDYMENYSPSIKINWKDRFKKYDQRITNGQKFLLTIKKVFEENLKMLSEDVDSNPECPDHLDFGKEFKYMLKSDGLVVSKTLDAANKVEVNCKRVKVDQGKVFVDEFLKKLS